MLVDNVELNADTEQILNDLRDCLIDKGSELFSNGFKKSGDNIMMQCPYHSDGQERKPSAGIRISDGVFHCFACGKTCSFQEFISNCFGYDDGGLFGIKWLLKNYACVKVEARKDVELDLERSKVSRRYRCTVNPFDPISYDSGVNSGFVSQEELAKYRYIHPYMYERGLTDAVIELFDIGYDKRDRCITFPVRDIQGHCLFVARRSVDYKFFHYPLGVAKPVYGLYEIELYSHGVVKSSNRSGWREIGYPKELIICESMLDALSFWTVGKFAVALNGTGDQLQFEQLRRYQHVRKYILCTDMDKAGMRARQVLKRELSNKIVTEYMLPEGRKDANECTKEELLALNDYF